MLRAVVFDVDGTLAETEECHRQAFNRAFAEAGLDWVWDIPLYKALLTTTGGRERIFRYAGERGEAVDARVLHRRKTEIYNAHVRSGAIGLRPGVAELIERARKNGLKLAIGTTTSRPNVLSLLDATLGAGSAAFFDSIRTGEDVRAKKPDPEVYQLVLADLELSADECLCVEDTRNGLLAAQAAGMRTVITPSLYSADEDFSGASLIIQDLAQPWSSPARPATSLSSQPREVQHLLASTA